MYTYMHTGCSTEYECNANTWSWVLKGGVLFFDFVFCFCHFFFLGGGWGWVEAIPVTVVTLGPLDPLAI